MGKQFRWEVDPRTEAFTSTRKADSIAAEERLDGICVIRTNLQRETLGDGELVRAHKSLARVARAFRSLKTVQLKVRPIVHWRERRVRAHLLLCMLAYYLEFHIRRLARLLFAEEGGPPPTKRKDCTRETLDGRLPLQSFPDLLGSLSTLTTVEPVYEQVPGYVLPALSAMTPLPSAAFELPGVKPHPAPSLARPGEADAPSARAVT